MDLSSRKSQEHEDIAFQRPRNEPWCLIALRRVGKVVEA